MYENLKYLSPMLQNAVEQKVAMGGRLSVFKGEENIFRESFGWADAEKQVPMGDGAIFRLFSLTKPVTAAALMILLERGRIELRYPLKWFIPTFENPTVLDEKGSRPAERDITLRDLLTMTSGIPYPEDTPSGHRMGEVWGRQADCYLKGGELLSTADFAREMGKCPLSFTPGLRWMYGASADVLGAVIEIISGKKLSEFMREEIFEPLGMNDTGFWIPPEKYNRLVTAYDRKEEGNSQIMVPYKEFSLCLTDYSEPPAFESGGAGLVSTLEDYEKFVGMLAGRGAYKGVRILGRQTVELMTRNFLTPEQCPPVWDSMIGHGYGAFMRILTDPAAAGMGGSPGEYGWDGWLGCYFSVDPVNSLYMLYFIQQTNSGCTEFVRRLQNVIRASI